MSVSVIEPDIANPYPDDWNDISDFTYETPLVLRRQSDSREIPGDRETHYIVAEPYTVGITVDGTRRQMTVPKGMLTDLASVPRGARWLVGRVGPHLEASIVHDFLYQAWQDVDGRGARRRDRDFADQVFRVGLEDVGMSWLIRRGIYLAVRTFGWGVFQSENTPRYVAWADTAAGDV